MNQPLFTGVCSALITPFYKEKIDEGMVKRLIHRQMETGIKAFVVAGTTGESPTLSDEEKLMLIKIAIEATGSEGMVIAGTGSNDTAHAVALSKAAEAAGADGVLVVSPYYNKANPDGLIRHYETIAHSISIPVIIYNVPSRTGLDIPVCVYEHLCQIPNIVGVKEANPDITKITRIRNACGEDFSIWSGNDDQIVPVMALGGKGVISVVSNVMPATTFKLCAAALAGDFKTASKYQCQLAPLISALFSDVNPIPVKAAMRLIGLDCGDCRLPLGALDAKKQRTLEGILK